MGSRRVAIRCQEIFGHLSGICRTFVRQLFWSVVSQLSGSCLAVSKSCWAVFKKLSDGCWAAVRQLSGSCLAVVRKVLSSCRTGVGQVSGNY